MKIGNIKKYKNLKIKKLKMLLNHKYCKTLLKEWFNKKKKIILNIQAKLNTQLFN